MSSSDVAVLAEQARVFAKAGQREQAIVAYQRLLTTAPTDVVALTYLGTTLFDLQRYDEGRDYFQRLLACKIERARLLQVVKLLGRVGQMYAMPLRVMRAENSLNVLPLESVTKAGKSVHDCAPTVIPGGTTLTVLPGGEHHVTAKFSGIGAVLLKVDGEALWPDVLLSGGALIDINCGYKTLELAGHLDGNFPVKASAAAGALQFDVQETKAVTIDEPIGVLTAVSNYSSWILGQIPRLHLYKMASPRLKIALHGDARPFHLQSLASLGIGEDQIIRIDPSSSLRAREMYYATPTFLNQNIAFACLEPLRDTAEQYAEPGEGRSLYIARSALGPDHDRLIRNETEIEAILQSRGFEIIHPQHLSFAEQARLFASARRIVAPFGAAWANAVFCKPGVKACMIRTKQTPEFDRLLQWVRADSYYVTPERTKAREGNIESRAFEFTVNPQHIAAFVAATE